jgi:hypothetical protein
MKARRGAAQQLRQVIDRLPLGTRRAMLEGIESNRIVIGGNYDMRGGVCPIVAVHRRASARVGRAFGHAWDRYGRARLPRAATDHELTTLRSMLTASIDADSEPPVSLSEAIASHQALLARSTSLPGAEAEQRAERPRRDTGERNRARELRAHHGWAWTRPVRRYEDFEAALEFAEEQHRCGPGSEAEMVGSSSRE